jgi:carboxypeptidase PM20D1
MKKLLLAVATIGFVLLGVALGRAVTLRSGQAAFLPDAPADLADVNVDAAASRLAGAVRFRTISNLPPQPFDTTAFLGLHAYLEETYPGVHGALSRERVNDLSLLFTWEGTDPGLAPVVLMGHLDVVPIIPGTEEEWSYGAFDGVVADGFVWGRGTMDDKVSVLAILEAVESLVAEGYRPERTLYLAFGHDEEIGGPRGAAALADTIARRSPKLALVVDEGGAVVEDAFPGLTRPAALVGVAEKGFLSVRLRARAEGGHSSMPPATTSVGILAAAIHRLEQSPFPASLDGPTGAMLQTLAPELSLGMRTLLGNLWLFGPLVERVMTGTSTGAAMVRTTTAATMFTVESTLDRIRRVVDDERVELEVAYEGAAQDPSPVSDPGGAAFTLVARTIHEALGNRDLIVLPYLVVGGTDAKYYSGRSPNVFRFLPVSLGERGPAALHGTDERLPAQDFADAIRFFHRLIRNTGELSD